MIIAYTGMPGSGKTKALAWRVMKAQKEGRICFSNVNIKGTFKISLEDLITYRFPEGCDVFIDEAGRWFNSRSWKDLPPEVFDMFTMHRHLQMNLFIAVQSFARIDKSLREVVELVYWSRNTSWLPFHKYEGYYDLEKVGSMKKEYNVSHLVWKTRKVHGMFNTHSMKSQFAHKEEVPYVEWDAFSVANKKWNEILEQKMRIKKKRFQRRKIVRAYPINQNPDKIIITSKPFNKFTDIKRNQIINRGILKRNHEIYYPIRTVLYVRRLKKQEQYFAEWEEQNKLGFEVIEELRKQYQLEKEKKPSA